MRSIKFLVILCLILLLQACGGGGTTSSGSDPDGDPSLGGTKPEKPAIFKLVDPTSSPNNDPTPIVLVSGGGVKPGNTIEIYENSNCTSRLKTVEADATSEQIQLPSLDDAAYHFSARTKNGSVFSDCKSQVNYTVDTEDPSEPVVTSPDDGDNVGSALTIIGTCETGSDIYVTGDLAVIPDADECVGGNFSVNVTLSPGDGSKDLSLQAQDAAGNNSTTASLNVTLDTVAPDVTINQSGGQADPTNDPVISFTIVFSEEVVPSSFSAGDISNVGSAPGVTFDTPTTLDNITWTVETDAVGSDGTVIPVINAGTVLDIAGNINNASTSTDNTVTYDITPPDVSIGAPSKVAINTGFITYVVTYTGASSVNLTSADVTVNVTGNVTFTKSVSHGTTSSPTISVHVTGGDGTIDSVTIDPATSQDAAGNTDLGNSLDTDVTVDSTLVTVSLDAPDLTLLNVGDVNYAVEYAGAVTINLTDSDINVTSSGVVFTVEVTDGTTSTPTVTLHVTGGDGTITGISIDPGTSDNGMGSFDTGTSEGTDIVVDNTPPTVSISTPMTDISASNDNTYSFGGTCTEDGSVITITAPGALAGNNTTCSSSAFTFTNQDVSGVPDGSISFTVSIEDGAGNSSTDTESADKDATAPVISALTLNDPASSPGNDTTPTIDVTGTFDIGDSFRLYTDMTCTTAASAAVVASVVNTVTITTSAIVADGTYTFFAKGTDPFGNAHCETVNAVSYTLDTVLPTLTINALANITTGNQANYSISGTCTDEGDDISITAPVGVVGATTCALGVYSIAGLDVSGQAEGTVNFTLHIEDTIGNFADTSSSATKDTIAPTISINALSLIGTSNEDNYTITGTCSANGDVISIDTPVIPGSAVCTLGAFSFTGLDVSALAEGNIDFTLSIEDAVGNSATDMESTVKDTTVPTTPSCDSLAGDATPTRSDTVTWTGSTDAESGIDYYEMSIGIAAPADTVAWTDIGATGDPYQFTGISPKLVFNTDYTTYIRAVDNAGNISDVATCTQWHLKNGFGNFMGNETTDAVNPTYVNQATAYALVYSDDNFNPSYFDHSTVANEEQIIIKEPGNYLLSHTLPVTRVTGAANSNVASVTSTIKINGVVKNIGFAANSFTKGKSSGVSNILNSSNHMTVLLENLAINDIITIETKNNALATEYLVVPVGSNFSTYLEYIPDEQNIFTATSTAVTNGTNLNQTTARKFKWLESINDSGYTHSDVSSSENITIATAGDYLVSVNLPWTGVKANQKVEANIYINGSNQNQTSFMDSSTGFISSNSSHLTSSTNYTNILYNVPAGAVLDVRTTKLGNNSTVTVTSGKAASIFIQKIDTSADYYVATGTSPANWNTVAATEITWTTDHVKDASLFTHSTSVNPQNITVAQDGDYIAYISDRITAPTTPDYVHPMIKIKVNGTAFPGAECNGNHTRTSYTGTRTASCDMVILLPGLSTNDVITLTTQADAVTTGTTTGNPPRITLRRISE